MLSDITRPTSNHEEIAGTTKPVYVPRKRITRRQHFHAIPAESEASNYLDKGVNEEQQRKKDELKVSREVKQSLGESVSYTKND